ncbi:ATP-binding protein [Gemmatimonas sp.]|uniref:ATP-binding protein n=1 Tax=Gemmatimonas sp. TaxID=1962908 RepID=UPI00286E3383|nr:ATP-binding protein [Gemmatimonas sp.]
MSLYSTATFVLYFAAQAGSLELSQRNGGNAGLWPASAVGLVFILGAPNNRRWLAALVTVGANAAAHLLFGSMPVEQLPLALGVRLLADWGGAELVIRVLGARPALNRSQPMLAFAALVALVVTPIVATVGALASAVTGGPAFPVSFIQWYVPEVVMTLMLAPALWASVQWVEHGRHRPWRAAARRGLERAVVLAVLAIAVGLVTLQPTTSVVSLPISIAAVPLMIVIAYRYGVGTTAWAGIVMFATLLLVTAGGAGPFANSRAPGFTRYVAIELYAGVLSISLVLMAAALKDLRESSDRLQSFLNTTDSAIVAVDSGRRIVGFSPNAARMFLKLANHSLARGQDPLGPVQGTPDTMIRRTKAWTSALAGQPDSATLEPDPATRVEMRYEPMLGADGQIVGAVATAIDLVQQEREEQASTRASRLEAIGRLAGGVAHDVNNLMTIVLGQTFVLRSGVTTGSEVAAIEEIEETVERTKRLSAQLLAFSRAQSLAPTVVTLATQVDATVSLLRRVVEERTVIHAEHRGPDWRVSLDIGQFEQVLLNLAVNARDAMPDGGELNIVTDSVRIASSDAERTRLAPGEYATLQMCDTGQGIAPEFLRDIFEPFVTTKGSKGTGLGLATVDAIMRKAGGDVTVESRLGIGTCFRLRFPRSHAAATVLPPRRGVVPPASKPAKLIVCEDEPAIRRIVIRTLESAGYLVHEAPTADDALAWLDGAGDDSELLVSDIVMPGMSGVQLLRAARAKKPQLRVLLMTGYSDGVLDSLEDIERPDGLLAKPFRGEELIASVQQILAGPRPAA